MSFITRDQLNMNTQDIISQHLSRQSTISPSTQENGGMGQGNVAAMTAAAIEHGFPRNLQHSLFNIANNTSTSEDSGKRFMIDASNHIKKSFDEVKQSPEMIALQNDFKEFTTFNIKCQFDLLNEYKDLFTDTKILTVFILNLYDEKYGSGLLTKYPSLQFYINFIVISVINGFYSRFNNLNTQKERRAKFSKINILKKKNNNDKIINANEKKNNDKVSEFEKTDYYINFKGLYTIGEYTKLLVPSCFAAVCMTINQNIISRKTGTGNVSENGLECNFLTPIFCRVYVRRSKDNDFLHLDGMKEIKYVLMDMIPGSGTDVDMFQLGTPRNPKPLCGFTNSILDNKLQINESETLFTIINDLPISLHSQGNKKIIQAKTYSTLFYVLKDSYTELTAEEEKKINDYGLDIKK